MGRIAVRKKPKLPRAPLPKKAGGPHTPKTKRKEKHKTDLRYMDSP